MLGLFFDVHVENCANIFR